MGEISSATIAGVFKEGPFAPIHGFRNLMPVFWTRTFSYLGGVGPRPANAGHTILLYGYVTRLYDV